MQIKAAKDAAEIEALKNEELLRLREVSSDEYLAALSDFAAEEKETFLNLKQNVSEIYSEIASIADDKIGSVIKSQEKLEDKLSSYGSKFTHHTVLGGADDGGDLSFYLLQDFAQTNKALEDYYKAISTVKARILEGGFDKSVASDFLSVIADMSIDKGETFASLLGSASDSEFSRFINGYVQNQALSRQISSLLYADDMEKAADDTAAYMKAELEKIGFEVPESFTLSGTVSAENFGEAFVSELSRQLEGIRLMIDEFSAGLSVYPSEKALSSQSKNVTYNQSFNIGTTKDSAYEQISAWKSATAKARQRGD